MNRPVRARSLIFDAAMFVFNVALAVWNFNHDDTKFGVVAANRSFERALERLEAERWGDYE